MQDIFSILYFSTCPHHCIWILWFEFLVDNIAYSCVVAFNTPWQFQALIGLFRPLTFKMIIYAKTYVCHFNFCFVFLSVFHLPGFLAFLWVASKFFTFPSWLSIESFHCIILYSFSVAALSITPYINNLSPSTFIATLPVQMNSRILVLARVIQRNRTDRI